MVYRKPENKLEYNGTIYAVGQEIIGTPESEYEGLYGYITEIRDGNDKKTENKTPDIYCSFEPPVLPYEIKRLEQVFSDLHHKTRTLDDIILDKVILAPEKVKPLDDLDQDRNKMDVWVLVEDWAIEGDYGSSCRLFAELEDARRMMTMLLRFEKKRGTISQWMDRKDFAIDAGKNSYSGYLDGEYIDNHYSLSLEKQSLILPAAE